MSHARILSDPQFHAWAPEVLKAIQRDGSVDTSDLYIEIGLSRNGYEAVAGAAAAAMDLRDDGDRVKKLPWVVDDHVKLIGWVAACAEAVMADGLPYSLERVGLMASEVIASYKSPLSAVDARDTAIAMTTHRAMVDWTLPEIVERAR